MKEFKCKPWKPRRCRPWQSTPRRLRPRWRWWLLPQIPSHCPPKMEMSGRLGLMVVPDQRSRNPSWCRPRWFRCSLDSLAGSTVLRSRWCCRLRKNPLAKVQSKGCTCWNKIQIKFFKLILTAAFEYFNAVVKESLHC